MTPIDDVIRNSSGSPAAVTRSVLARARALSIPRRVALARLRALRPESCDESVRLRSYPAATRTSVATALLGYLLSEKPSCTPHERRVLAVTTAAVAATILRAAGASGGAISGEQTPFIDTMLVTCPRFGTMLGLTRHTARTWLELGEKKRVLSIPQRRRAGGMVVRLRRPRETDRKAASALFGGVIEELAGGEAVSSLGWVLMNATHPAFAYGDMKIWLALVCILGHMPHAHLGLSARDFARCRRTIDAHIDCTDAHTIAASADAHAVSTGADVRAQTAWTVYEQAAATRRAELQAERARRVAIAPVIAAMKPGELTPGTRARWVESARAVYATVPEKVRPYLHQRLVQVLAKTVPAECAQAAADAVCNPA